MAKKEDIKAEVRAISLDAPGDLRSFVDNPYSYDALCKLKSNHTGKWRNEVIAFVDRINDSYDIEHIKKEIDVALQSRSKLESFFGNSFRWVSIVFGLSLLYWVIFNFWTGVLLFIVLFVLFTIGNDSVNAISKDKYTGDTLRLLNDFDKIRH